MEDDAPVASMLIELLPAGRYRTRYEQQGAIHDAEDVRRKFRDLLIVLATGKHFDEAQRQLQRGGE